MYSWCPPRPTRGGGPPAKRITVDEECPSVGWYKQLGQRVQDASTVSCRGRKGFRSLRRLCGGYRHPSRVAPGLFCRTRGGTRCTCAPPRCWPASLGWGHTAATGCWSAPRTRRRWGSSCSAGCLGRCRRPRRLGVWSQGRVRAHTRCQAVPGLAPERDALLGWNILDSNRTVGALFG